MRGERVPAFTSPELLELMLRKPGMVQEFEAGGNPEGYLEELVQLARDGAAKGKVDTKP